MGNEVEKERFKVYKEMLFTAILERFKILPTISALAATLLIVATFNKDLIPINVFVKFILAVLLLIIPFSLFGYLWELKKAEDKAIKYFEQFGGSPKMKLFDKFWAYYPWIAFIVLSLAIFAIIILIFRPEIINIICNQ